MDNLKEKIIKKIENGEVKKKSFLYFLTKKYILWSSLFLFVLVGSVSFSIFLLNYFDDFGPWYRLRGSSDMFLSNIFFIWIILFLIFLVLVIFNFKQTKKSFRFELWKIISFSLFIILIFGLLFYRVGMSEKIDSFLGQKSERYHKLKIDRKNQIEKILILNNIDVNKFFQDDKIIELEEKWRRGDKDRVEKIKNILNGLKGKLDEKNIKRLEKKIREIKEKKKRIDLLRLEEEIDIFKKNMLK